MTLPLTGKRLAAAILSALLATLEITAWFQGRREIGLFATLTLGLALGSIYAVRGRLPGRVYDDTDSPWAAGAKLTRDDDPRNISPKIYLPLILAALGGAAIAFYCFVLR